MFTNKVFLLESFYNEKSELSIISSKVNQRISVKKPTHSVFSVNWHFNLRFVLKRTKTLDFVFITEILWWTFWRKNWWSVFAIAKILRSSNPDIPYLPSLIGSGVAGMENEGNQEHQLNIPRLNSLQDRSLSPNFLALWKTRVG